MTLEQMFFISQTVAAFAIVGSLLFVAMELRNSNRDSRHRELEETREKYTRLILAIVGNPDLSRVWFDGIHNIDALEPAGRGSY